MSTSDRRTSILIDPDSWLAGVMDTGGSFDLWRSAGGRWCWRVAIRMNSPQAAAKFTALSSTKLRQIGVNRYVVEAESILPLLNRVMPRMFCLHEAASVVYRYLLTRPGRKGMRGPLTGAVDRYRTKMVARLRDLDATERTGA